MCIIPVKIRHRKNIKKQVLTYAMLDSCSQGSFTQEDLVKVLQLSGKKTTLNLKKLNGAKTESTMLIEGIAFKGVSGNNSWIKLLKMFSRIKLPFGKQEIATPDKIKQWDYLKVIASDITQTDGIKVGLLIGANFLKALEPLKVISSVDDHPYAYLTRLNWCIVGAIINMVGKKSIGYNRVAVIDATSSNISSHHFITEEPMKEDSLDKMCQTLYKNDFSEASTI